MDMLSRRAVPRNGRRTWLGRVSLGLALLSWVLPIGDIVVGAVAVGLGLVALLRTAEERIDWVAAAGAAVGFLQVLLSVMLIAADVYG